MPKPLRAFASHYGADFYGVARNKSTITLHQQPHQMPDSYRFGKTDGAGGCVVPLGAGEALQWVLDNEL